MQGVNGYMQHEYKTVGYHHSAYVHSGSYDNAQTGPSDEVTKKRKASAPSSSFERDSMDFHSFPHIKQLSMDYSRPAHVKGDPERDETGGPGSGAMKGFMRLPEVIEALAADGKLLRWDEGNNWYQVLDGPAFEAAFNELRYKRGDQAKPGRPFSRMHMHFLLVRGEKWAGTGTCFTPKVQPNLPMPQKDTFLSAAGNAGADLSARNIIVTLRTQQNPDGFQCSLQHFLDITGAGDVYRTARENQLFGYGTGWWSSSQSSNDDYDLDNKWAEQGPVHWAEHELTASGSYPSHQQLPQTNIAAQPNMMLQASNRAQGDKPITSQDMSVLIGSMWTQDARGDQAYFFQRRGGLPSFDNGAIVSLVDGVLCPDNDPRVQDAGLYMVVSDKNAKWKGEPIPSPEDEKTGHWCAFLGQVPVRVAGRVQCGQYVGPRGDGSGVGVVRHVGEHAVIGIALVSKDTEEVGVVKTLVFAGLNAMNQKVDGTYKSLFKHALEMQKSLYEMQRNMVDLEQNLQTAQITMGITEHNMSVLENRVNKIEYKIHTDGHSVTMPEIEKVIQGLGSVIQEACLARGPAPEIRVTVVQECAVTHPKNPVTWWWRHRFVLGALLGTLVLCAVVTPSVIVASRGDSQHPSPKSDDHEHGGPRQKPCPPLKPGDAPDKFGIYCTPPPRRRRVEEEDGEAHTQVNVLFATSHSSAKQ